MKNNGRLIACFLACALLAGCANDPPSAADNLPTRPAQQVLDHCLAILAPAGMPPPAPDSLNESQWSRYVGCAIGANLHAPSDQVRDNPEALVEVRVAPNGEISAIQLLGSSGNAAWDHAVDRSIGATPALHPAPAGHRVSRMVLHFKPVPQGLGMPSAAGLSDESHWSRHQCIWVSGMHSCN
ncbi:TonB C-terminal domain-containing protein [Paraburkholderia sp. Cy-641]|uniref:energy transducer TonB n=1 Tax=Paraburkholderia sp. Cy-641 TaxID=2608337 RepID=UPI00142359BB|nr:energy transducer TonB [Paraburkholderia sp. Cy-641]NIF80600.1 TonB C-terminal domain-containing protein [Paraburkholderia sp. Cy-641]